MNWQEIRMTITKHLRPLGLCYLPKKQNDGSVLIMLWAQKTSGITSWSTVDERSRQVKSQIESDIGLSVTFQLDKAKKLAWRKSLSLAEKKALKQAPSGSRTKWARKRRPDDFESWNDKCLPRG